MFNNVCTRARLIVTQHKYNVTCAFFRVDTFDVKGKGLGNVDKIFVRHDGSGSSPGWYIKKIVVLNRSSNEMYECPGNQWLQSSAPYAWFSCYQSA